MLTVVTKQLDSAVSHEWQKIYDFPKKGLFSPYFDMLWSWSQNDIIWKITSDTNHY